MSYAHLLSFRYERPVETPPTQPYNRRKGQQRAHRPKEHFLQTNFRFVLAPTAPPAHPAVYDADSIIDWDYVDLVSLPSPDGQLADCAICLDRPQAPRITKCGHHFCAACVLRHLAGHRTRRCPLCFEGVCRGDLRPVEVTPVSPLEAGQKREFVLLARPKGTLTPFPVAAAAREESEAAAEAGASPSPAFPAEEEEEGKSPTRGDNNNNKQQQRRPRGGSAASASSASSAAADAGTGIAAVLPEVGAPHAAYCRLLLASAAHEAAALAREAGELAAARREAVGLGEEEWLPFIDEALAELAERRRRYAARREALGALGDGTGAAASGDAATEYLPPGAAPAPAATAAAGTAPHTPTGSKKGRSASPPGGGGGGRGRPRGYSAGSGGEAGLQPQPLASPTPASACDGEREGKQPSSSPSSDASSSSSYHFFQLGDGQLAFLHPLNMRCLMADAGGDQRRLPAQVSGKVLEVEAALLTPELRARYAFLRHLPLYSQVQLVELDLRPPSLSEATYAQFKPEIKKRQQRRRNRERAEARERRAAAVAAAAAGGGIGSLEALRGVGLTEEEIAAIKARREHVDLDGPLPWQAMLIAEGQDPEKVLQLMQEQEAAAVAAESEAEPQAGDASAAVTPGSTPPEAWGSGGKGSFAEITRMNGHYPTLLREGDFPALGGPAPGPGPVTVTVAAASSSSSPPQWGAASAAAAAAARPGSSASASGSVGSLASAASPPTPSTGGGAWGGRAGGGSSTPLPAAAPAAALSASPPQWAARLHAPASGGSRLSTTAPIAIGGGSSSSSSSSSSGGGGGGGGGAWGAAARGVAPAAPAMRAGCAVLGAAAAAGGKKKGKGKGISISLTGSQRSYA